mmetsp:Transcript_52883/g.113353  ORF Transcript_52883/g.113353 Transcript_52883/m.113353 type:complete len:200 (+) Transcript_52883:1508-2107(+)
MGPASSKTASMGRRALRALTLNQKASTVGVPQPSLTHRHSSKRSTLQTSMGPVTVRTLNRTLMSVALEGRIFSASYQPLNSSAQEDHCCLTPVPFSHSTFMERMQRASAETMRRRMGGKVRPVLVPESCTACASRAGSCEGLRAEAKARLPAVGRCGTRPKATEAPPTVAATGKHCSAEAGMCNFDIELGRHQEWGLGA